MQSNWVDKVNELRIQLPSAQRIDGAPDKKALIKLTNEIVELAETNFTDATEIADVVYYAGGAVVAGLITKDQAEEWVEAICALTPLTTRQAFKAFEAKYSFRAGPGNPKNKVIERKLVSAAIS